MLAAPNAALTGATVVAGCNPDFAIWAVGMRTIWNPAPQFDIGFEVYYSKIETSGTTRARSRFNFAGAAAVRRVSTPRRTEKCGADPPLAAQLLAMIG